LIIAHNVEHPNLRHIPAEVLTEEINTEGNKQGEANEENLEFFSSAGFEYEA